MEFLGFLINTATYTVTVSNKKRKNLKSLLTMVLSHSKHKITIHFLAKIIGKIVSFFPASDEAKLHYRTLEKFKTKCLLVNRSWSAKIRLSEKCLKELQWWDDNVLVHDILSKSLAIPQPTQTIFTDSSGYGYGSVWNGEENQGLFTEKQKQLSINSKELLAIYFTLSFYAPRLKDEHLMLRCDNYTAIYCILQRGSRDDFRDYITKCIFDLARNWNFYHSNFLCRQPG